MLFWLFCVVKVHLGEKALGFWEEEDLSMKLDLCFLPSNLHSSENVNAPARCNQTQIKSSTDLFKFYKKNHVTLPRV